MDQPTGKRRKPRLTVKDMTLTINGKTYRVVNINEYGVGFLVDSPDGVAIGDTLEATLDIGRLPVKVAGIARHVSQLTPVDRHLRFRSGWVCGTEFTTRHIHDGGALFEAYLADVLDGEIGESEE